MTHQFHTLTNRFPSSPSSSKYHNRLARARSHFSSFFGCNKQRKKRIFSSSVRTLSQALRFNVVFFVIIFYAILTLSLSLLLVSNISTRDLLNISNGAFDNQQLLLLLLIAFLVLGRENKEREKNLKRRPSYILFPFHRICKILIKKIFPAIYSVLSEYGGCSPQLLQHDSS